MAHSVATGANTAPSAGGVRAPGYSPFLPMLLLVLTGVVWPTFQCIQLVIEKQGLATVHTNQNKPYEDAGKLRTSLDNLARETAILADKGNQGAKLIVSELAKRGVTINPNAPPPPPPAK
jgi:hypothetical protein